MSRAATLASRRREATSVVIMTGLYTIGHAPRTRPREPAQTLTGVAGVRAGSWASAPG
ncbi:hypothetical protein FRIGORI9N_450007 [Frigoribacterium sp. 9N]|nr:hypothetical protein FRIGORI9N_450007 [Frigoribacterium sp. 9N]